MKTSHLLASLASLNFGLVFSSVIEGIAYSAPTYAQAILRAEVSSSTTSVQSEDVWDAAVIKRHLEEALATMQNEYFEVWLGQWPDSIDWTAAVLGTHVSATLNILSKSAKYTLHPSPTENNTCNFEHQLIEDQINRYFSQISAYYFGEDSFGIRLQAHDDMLWVNLGWLESIKLIDSHDALHHSSGFRSHAASHRWHGALFTPAFAHRAHVFYDIVSRAWDRTLCGGGLNWNPQLEVYKNTVTNTQIIAAAVGMYLYHPGDGNRSPVLVSQTQVEPGTDDPQLPRSRVHDPAFLSLAQEAYTWLQDMDMTNSRGLYVDGYHLTSWLDPSTHRRVYGKCDQRNEMVYTYNQGVVLSGLRQLWEATGNTSYLVDAHQLVSNVISATGWPEAETGWRGLGYRGILTELCDPRGTCSQDAHTFKGIFFHHLALMCEPLPIHDPLVPGLSHVASEAEASLHANSCRQYMPWVEHNARGAWRSRNEKNVMGPWWGAPSMSLDRRDLIMPKLPDGADDWRNANELHSSDSDMTNTQDWNDRGRGRTVESHSGGLAVLRALYTLHVFYD